MRWFKRSTESPKLLSLSPLRHSESGNVYGGNEPPYAGLAAHDHARTTIRRRSAGDGGGLFGMNPAGGGGDGEGHEELLSVPAGLSNSPSSSSTTSGSSSSSVSSPSSTSNSSSSCTTSSSPFSYTSDSKGSSVSSTGTHKILQSGTATIPRKSRIGKSPANLLTLQKSCPESEIRTGSEPFRRCPKNQPVWFVDSLTIGNGSRLHWRSHRSCALKRAARFARKCSGMPTGFRARVHSEWVEIVPKSKASGPSFNSCVWFWGCSCAD